MRTSGGSWPAPALVLRAAVGRDLAAVLLILSIVMLLGLAGRQMVLPLPHYVQPISLSVFGLPLLALRTVVRMLVALACSLIFTFTYATLAAKSRRAERILIPLLDALQSVPVLGYLSFTVVFFLALAPGSMLGAEYAAIFAIFTAQAWNMAFSFYQSLRTVPTDLNEACRSLCASPWQRFWRLEVPFAMPGLVWNAMMSMSGSWFFVVASEAIVVGDTHILLPGIGSYVAQAIEERNLPAIFYATVTMSLAILIYDQLLFRPLVAWADRFRVEQSVSAQAPSSWVLELLRSSRVMQTLREPIGRATSRLARARLQWLRWPRHVWPQYQPWQDGVWYALMGALTIYLIVRLFRYVGPHVSRSDLYIVTLAGAATLLRVGVLTVVASLIWVPVGIAVGLRPRLMQWIQPVAQFLAAFPANLLFPVAVVVILRFQLAPSIWLSPLMILGTQWYILFNAIAGASVLPNDLREAASSLRLRAWRKWGFVWLPGVFPFYVTGAITASGGAWNASIVSETVSWGTTRLSAPGLGAYIADRTDAGDYVHIALGVTLMSILVVAVNRLLWRPLYALAERRTRLD